MNIISQPLEIHQRLPGLPRVAWQRWFKRPLRLRIGASPYYFAGPTEFCFCMAARTAVPAERINELYHTPDDELELELSAVHKLAGQLQEIRQDFLEQGFSLRRTLQLTGTRMISKDHDWRLIFEELVMHACHPEHYLLIAVEQYLNYLAQRCDVIGSILLLKDNAAKTAPELATRSYAVLPDLNLVAANHDAVPLRRLAHGVPTVVRVEAGHAVPIRLAQHAYALSHSAGQAPSWAMVADGGQRYTLKDGQNSVGRSRENSVMLNSALRNISRQHLLAQPGEGSEIVLTDVSSGGTFVPSTALAG